MIKSYLGTPKMKVDSIVLMAQMPDWYQELSNEQVYILDNLHVDLREDGKEIYCPRSVKFLDSLGIYPPLSLLAVSEALVESDYRPIKFLERVAKKLAHMPDRRLQGQEYSCNERLLYSSIFHLLYPNLIQKLDVLLPKYRRRPLETAADFQYMPKPPNTDHRNPLLSVPHILQKEKNIADEYNKKIREKRKPLLTLLSKVTYKQDIINEMIDKIVCDENLKYQYNKGRKEFEILKRKFYELEKKREELERKLYPQHIFKNINLKYETFEQLELSKMPRKNMKQVHKDASESKIILDNSLSTVSKDMPSNMSMLSIDIADMEMDASSTSMTSYDSASSINIFPTTTKSNYFNRRFKPVENNVLKVENVTGGDSGNTPFRSNNKKYGNADNNNKVTTHNDDRNIPTKATNLDGDQNDFYFDAEDNSTTSSGITTPSDSSSSGGLMKTESSLIDFNVSEATFRRTLIGIKQGQQLDAAIRYLTIKNEYLHLLPCLQDLPKLRIWYEMRMRLIGEGKKLHFTKPGKDVFEERLKRIKSLQIKLPQIKHTKVCKKALLEEIERTRALFTQQLRLRLIELSRELFTLYNVDCLPLDVDRKHFKRLFFAMFPNREKDILVKK